MANGRDRYRSRRNRMRVRELLLKEWDPFGVGAIPECRDEYDAEADLAYVLLMDRGATVEDLTAWLLRVETRDMELSAHPERARRVAEALLALKPEFEAEPDEPFPAPESAC